MAFHLPGKNNTTKSEAPKPVSADAAQEELNGLLDMNDEAPVEPAAPAPAPAESEPAAPKEKKSPPPAKKKDPSSKKASSKGKKGPTYDYTTDAKLRKDSSDPTAKRISARVSSEIYEDLGLLRVRGMSMDYTITSSLRLFMYNKYTCSCGMVFFTDGEHGEPKCCPACGNPGFHKERIR